ncbi:secretin N-terminal domain-containing protein [Armatimonas sp.]|uniref:secretin N-terminal domain-containing protein n=1 Tax=Armatimonas sp. TaxID=1872638 RepID=UPI00286C1032|nr:secretin N-terminal domain-containing protein [Armatimonas sp.]
MKTNLFARHFPLLLLAVALMPSAAHAQFDQFGGGGFGGGMDFPKPVWEQFKLNPKTRLKLDFRNASIDAVLSVFSKASGIAIVKDPALTGGITLQSPTDQPLKDAFAQLNAILGLKNFDLTKSGNFLVIKARPQSGRGGTSGRSGSGFPTGFDPSMFSGRGSSSSSSLAPKVYQLKYASASQVARVINDVFQGSGQQSNPLAGLGALMGNGGVPGATGGAPTPPTGGTPPPNGPNPGPDPDPQRGGFGGFGGSSSGRSGFPSFGSQGGFGGLSSLFGGRGGSTTVVRASADDYSNSVIVNAPTREQDQVADLIAEIDKQTEQPQKSQVFKLDFATASDLVTVVQNVLIANVPRGRGGTTGSQQPIDQRFGGGGGFGGFGGFGRGSSAGGQGNVVAEARTNSLIITGTQENLDLIGKVVKELDKPITFENSTFVITLENARADQLADVLNQSFGSRTGARTTARPTGLTGATNRTNTNNRNTGGGNAPGSLGRSQDQPDGPLSVGLADPMAAAGELATNVTVQQGFGGFGGFGGGGFSGFGGTGSSRSSQQAQGTRGLDSNGRVVNLRDLTGQVTIIPDINTNSVIIVTSPQNRELLQQIVDQLDKIPEQVMIETVIVEASLDANNKLGVEWNFTQGKILGETGARGAGSSSFGGQASTTQPQGLRYTLTGGQYGAFLQSLQTDSRFEVLSTPRIFTSNNATAEINISQSLPYVTSTQTNGQGVQIFNYAFLDVGIILTVTPRITSNGFVTMDVTQTANDFVRYTDFNAPVVNQREAQTTVSVKDGETIVLGGIIKSSVSATTNKLPILGDVPILGKLFQSNTTTKSKTELLVFLTPRIVRDPEEARKLRDNTARQMQSKLKDKLPEFNTTPDKDKLKPVEKPKTDDKIPPVEKKKTDE